MLSSFKHLKLCDKKTRNTINGYIREIQELFPWEENSYYIIPELVNHICLSFYWIKFAFNKKYIGDNLEFINDTTVTKVKSDTYSVCAIGEAISGDLCDIFRIEYCVKKTGKNDFCPYIGFFKTKSIDSNSNIEWNAQIGRKSSEIAFAIYNCNKTFLSKYPKTSGISSERYHTNQTIKRGDRFMLEFDFKTSECHIYHNDEKLKDYVKFDCTHIIPCLSLYFRTEIVEITRYDFIHVPK